jgi:secreted Zn-dependent insulinase-like peptidase
MSVEISLTEKGELNYQRILELLFMIINQLKKDGIRKYVFDE